MPNSIQYAATTGQTLYALVRDSDADVWKVSISEFVPYATADLAHYEIVLGEQGVASGYYAGSFPAVPAGLYRVSIYQRVGGSAAEGDPLIATYLLDWAGADTGSAGQALARLPASLVNGHMSASAQELAAGLANALADALLDRLDAIETGYTPRKALRLMLAALAGKLSGAGGATVSIRNVTDTKTRIQAAVDAVGNRTALTLDAS
jgi:hypothetical protein